MSSPSLPSLSSLQPVPRPQGFVTARSILADLESQDNGHTEPPDIIAPPEQPKKGRPKKAVDADNAPAITRPRKKATTTANASLAAGDVSNPPAKPTTRKRQAAITNEQEGAIDAPPAPKRGRPKKAVAIENDVTALTDTIKIAKPTVKRARKKAIESADVLDNAAAAEKPKPPPPPPRPRKTKAPAKATSVTNDPIAASEVTTVNTTEVVDSGVKPVLPIEAPVDVLDLDRAPNRRRDWTPPTDSALPPSFQQSSGGSPISESPTTHVPVDVDDAGDAPAALDFTRLMGDFGYQEDNPRPPPALSRTPSDGPTTKRKRLEPVDVSAIEEPKKRKRKAGEPNEPKPPKEPKQPKAPKEPKPRPPKKPKAPKKKPLTITALATAAYLPQSAITDGDQTKLISDFFPQPQTGAEHLPAGEAAPAKPIGSTNGGPAENKPAPKRKRAPKKVQITVPEVHIKLDSPEAARENARKQQWLFGSSSQLAAAESPTELRDLQQALKESEDMISSQQMDTSRATSYAHVPSAPHGTSLSIGQGDRVLWMSAARDFEDSTFASDESADNGDAGLPDGFRQAQGPPSSAESAPESRSLEDKPEIEVLTISSSAPKELESPDSGYVDVDQIGRSSPQTILITEKLETDGSTVAAVAPDVISPDTTPETETVSRRALGTRDPNTNITKQTVDPESKKLGISPKKSITKPHVVSLDSSEKESTGQLRKTTDVAAPTRSPIVVRRTVCDSPALLALEDARKKYLGSPALSAREEARKRFVIASPTRDFLQPSQARSHDIIHSPALISPSKTSAKPLKTGAASNLASLAPRSRRKSVSPSRLPILSPPKPRGRTPKSGLASNPATPARARGQPRKSSIVEPSSDYLDIDAISDIEIPPYAPSPPRRLPTSPPKATLDFDKPPPPPLPPIATSTARCTAKQLLADFPSIAPTLFPKITSIVRSTPPSRDHKAPTWHEKILLYDPIVLEDLTSWLNSQGVRLELSVPRPVKGKGKKKAGEVDDEESVMDLVQEELQPWMVQKWCEEHSICCLWKEGLRGGVRQRY